MTSYRRQSLTDASASRGDANKGKSVREPERLGGLPAMAAPKSSLAAAAILALWPGYGLEHDDERQNQFVTVTKMVDQKARKGGKDTK